MKQSKKLVTKIVAVAVAFSMTVAFVPAKADAASKKPTLSKTKATIELGSKVTLKVKKNKTTIKSTKWTTSDKEVATVSKKGVVKAAGSLGKATIKATVKYKSGKKTKTAKLSCKVTVKDWAQEANPTVSAELKASIDKYFSTISGINVVPFAVLANSKSQNAYRVFCKCNKVVKDPVEYYAIYNFYRDKNNNVKSYTKFADAEGVIDVYPTESTEGFAEVKDQSIITTFADQIKAAVKAKEIPYPRLITPHWVADRYKTWGENSAPYQVRVMGNFPQQGEDTLIPLLWIELAMERWEDTPEGSYKKLGVDVAAYGSDKTVIAELRGLKIMPLNVYSQKNTRETAGLVISHAKETGTRNINVDEIGIGRGVVDSLEEEGYENVGVNVAEKSHDIERFHNLRAELWWNLRERLDPDKEPIALPRDDELLSELASVKYKVDARGAIQIESKEDMKKRLGHSPDRADAVVLACAENNYQGFAMSGGDLYVSKFFR